MKLEKVLARMEGSIEDRRQRGERIKGEFPRSKEIVDNALKMEEEVISILRDMLAGKLTKSQISQRTFAMVDKYSSNMDDYSHLLGDLRDE